MPTICNLWDCGLERMPFTGFAADAAWMESVLTAATSVSPAFEPMLATTGRRLVASTGGSSNRSSAGGGFRRQEFDQNWHYVGALRGWPSPPTAAIDAMVPTPVEPPCRRSNASPGSLDLTEV